MDLSVFYRALAAAFAQQQCFAAVVDGPASAVAFFVDHVHGGGCPGCAGTDWRPAHRHHLDCPRCGRVSVYRGTPLHRRRLRLEPLLAAIHAVHVDAQTPSTRGFSRAWQLRLETTWRLLHELRGALPPPPCPAALQLFPLLGAESVDNHAAVAIGSADGRTVACAARFDEAIVEVDVAADAGSSVFPLAWGQLRAWLTAIFRGVSNTHLDNYLHEWSDRQRRLTRLAAAAASA